MLELRISAKRFPDADGLSFDVLRNFALDLRRGETVTLFGPSGCGKTTILRIAAGLDTAFEGSVTCDEHARLGMAFQEPTLLPWRSVRDNLRIAVEAAGVGEGTALDLADRFGLSAHLTHYPHQLSLGLARRVAFVRALAVEPSLLLLDEPLASLDAATSTMIAARLIEILATRPASTLMVTHDPDEAAALADRIVILHGRPARIVNILAIDPPPAARSVAQRQEASAKLRALVRDAGQRPA